MNDLVPITASPPAIKEYYTAREIAEIALRRGIVGFPTSERGVRDHAESSGWNDLASHLCRRREGRGGGREYHVTLLPQAMRDALAGWGMQAALIRQHQAEQDADARKLAALRQSALAPHPRKVMEARAEVLRAIEGYAMAHQKARAWAIARFLDAQEAHGQRLETERRRDESLPLTEREVVALGTALVLTAADGFQLRPEVLVVANDRRARAKIGRSAIYEWFKTRDERGVVALAPVPPKQEQDIPAGFYDFLKFWALPGKPSVPEAHKDYLEAVEKRSGVQPMTVTLDQVQYILRNRIKGLDKYVGREGLLTLRSRMAYVTRTTDDMWPTTIYTADGKTFDAEVADPVSNRAMRPEITSVLDVATRKCVGYAVSRKENVIAVTEALRRSCSVHGICAIFYTDRGAGYKNKTFDADVGGLMGRLGITKMHALPYNSQAKGIIERFNHVWNNLAKRMPTYIGRDMDKEAKKAVHKETRSEIKEFGQARRLPSWADFIAAVEKTIADYNDEPHDGLPRFEDPETGRRRHMTPNEAWAAHVKNGFEPVRIDPAEEEDLFRPYTVCTTRRSQVRWNTNDYFHESLERYYGEKVMVGYDLHQADKVWVREFDPESGNPGKLICVALYMGNAQRYIPLTAEQKALETRSKSAIKRLNDKIEAKQAELDAPWLIEAQPVEIADFIDMAPEPVPAPAQLVVDNAARDESPAPRRRVFRSDEELAAWALKHPDELTQPQIGLLRECVASRNKLKVFQMAGIDTEALRTLLRAAAA
ncbi:Mu transposase C-terminal domain-containing protein [Gemmobacter sp.]|uniref:Mu transposase C-terminal domain-containing protein n=1 Tax=Gemmobacter sp. TaxID=1898957 RepID=UPI002AFFBA04|nr:Mu transposase C-terminal domain-containing protein [Gemmobacter sp.]